MRDVDSISVISSESIFGKVYFDPIGSVEIQHIILVNSIVQYPNGRLTVHHFVS